MPRFTETMAVAIGTQLTTLLREYTEDINKAISDLPGDAKQLVKIKSNVELTMINQDVLPVIKFGFATGKKIADESIVELKQEKFDGV